MYREDQRESVGGAQQRRSVQWRSPVWYAAADYCASSHYDAAYKQAPVEITIFRLRSVCGKRWTGARNAPPFGG